MNLEASLKSIFPGNSEMAQRMRAFDWANNDLGSPKNWPEALKTSVRIILNSRHPMFIWWGPNLIYLYNDGHASFLYSKHPEALGRPASAVWPEVWHEIIVPRIELIKNQDIGTFDEAMPFVNFRRGYPEETYATFSYSPILNDDGRFGGVICPVSEETTRIIGQRQMSLLRQLSSQASEGRNRKEVYKLVVKALRTDIDDIPFALIYELNVKTSSITLEAATDSSFNTKLAPKMLALDEDSIWPFKRVFESNAEVVTELNMLSEHFPRVREQFPINQAILLPLAKGNEDWKGVLIIGLSPLRSLDESYQEFLNLISAGVASSIQNANAYEAEKRRAEALAELDRAKTTFFSNVSHEFRTPLTLMLGPVEDALAETREPQQRKRLELIHRNAMRLQKLINTLLDFSRIEAGRIQASFEPLALAELTSELASVFRSTIEKAGMKLVVDCKPLDDLIYVDRDMYEKIVLNLLSNAFKFTFEGEIVVTLHDIGSVIELSVKDTGIGIEEKHLPHVFERFHRIEGVSARTLEGTGIGLALIQELAMLHGGSVAVKSVLNQGSTFTVCIPKGYAHLPQDRITAPCCNTPTALRAEHYLEEAVSWLPVDALKVNVSAFKASTHPINKGNDRHARIIWADDNADMRDYVSHLLSPHYEVEAVPNGKAALDAMYRQPPDLLLADVMMPLLDGFGLLHAVRSDERLCSIPIILLSARAGEESRIEGMACGADDYLIKPFSARELIARIDAHLNINRLRASKNKLAIQLAEAQQLQCISSRLIEENNIEALYDQILDVAMAIMGSDFSSIQMLDPKKEELYLLAWRNFHPESAKYWQNVSVQTGTPCSIALRKGERILLTDVYASDCLKNTENLRHFTLSGITAVQSTPLLARDGRVLGMISTHWRERHEPSEYELALFDVLVRQMADVLERQRTHGALKEADQRKDEFLAVLAHELRNPLCPVKNGIFLLQQNKETSNHPQLLQMMDRQVNHMIRLVDDLMEISRITTGKIELNRNPINLVNVIHDAIEASTPWLNSKQHQIILSLPSEPFMVNADAIRMTQVFTNLLNNAVKYTSEKGVITVTISIKNNQSVISVKDNGIGISAEMLPKVFEMFTQDKHSGVSYNSGLGIGLAMVRSLIELHGGTVKALSAGPYQGSEFIISLPLEEKKRDKTNQNQLIKNKPSFANLRVLIVDDHPDIVDSLGLLLRHWGINVQEASEGESALALLDDFNPHIVFLDIGMPGMDGYEVAKKIRQNAQYTAIQLVALTGWSQEKDRSRSKSCGFNEHLAKPVDINDLFNLFHKLISKIEREDIHIIKKPVTSDYE